MKRKGRRVCSTLKAKESWESKGLGMVVGLRFWKRSALRAGEERTLSYTER